MKSNKLKQAEEVILAQQKLLDQIHEEYEKLISSILTLVEINQELKEKSNYQNEYFILGEIEEIEYYH